MREQIKKALLSIDLENLNVEESKKSKETKHKRFFIKILNTLVSIQERADKVFTEYGLNLIMYEDLYFQVIEDLVYEHYGNKVAEVMFWYINGTQSKDNEDSFIEDEKSKKRYKVKTPTQVYNVCKKLKIFKKI